jgi:hypothetical protein
LDLDVFLFQSPTRAVAHHFRHQPTAELLVSGSFAVTGPQYAIAIAMADAEKMVKSN